VQAVFFDKKWFLTSQSDSLAYVTSVPVGGLVTLFGTSGTSLYQLYGNASASITSRVQTALLPMSDPIRTKQALKFGIEATGVVGNEIIATVDSEYNSSPPYILLDQSTWQNNSGQLISWTNNSSVIIPWTFTQGYYLYKSDAQQWGKYLGLTVTSQAPGFSYNTFEFEHELRTRF
jgi:hypothetical protein